MFSADQSKVDLDPQSPIQISKKGLGLGTIVRKAASVAKHAYAVASSPHSDEEMLPLKCCLMSISLPWENIAQDLLFKGSPSVRFRTRCLGNCSCIAYAYDLNIGCMFWDNTLIDSQEFDRVDVDLYIRLFASELDNNNDQILYIMIPVVAALVCKSILIFIAWWFFVKKKGDKANHTNVIEAGQMFTTDSTAITLKDDLILESCPSSLSKCLLIQQISSMRTIFFEGVVLVLFTRTQQFRVSMSGWQILPLETTPCYDLLRGSYSCTNKIITKL